MQMLREVFLLDKQYLTVAQVAEKAGVTKQAVYQRLNKDLNKYVKVIDNKKMLNISVLNEFEVKPVEQANSQELNNDLTSTLNTLNNVVDTLKQQLKVKDDQIKDLNNRLKQALNNQSQDNYIMMAQQQNKMLDTVTSPNEDIEQTDEPQGNISNVNAEVTETKQTFWSRIFNK